MKYLLALVILLVACSSPTPTPVPTLAPTAVPLPTATAAWYEGGTLHNSTVAEWRSATDANRLATAADWAANGFDLNTITELEERTPHLLDCITAGLDGYAAAYGDSGPMLDLATLCVMQLK